MSRSTAAPNRKIRDQVRSFVASAYKGHAPTDDEDIFTSGHLNSLFAMELVSFIEETYNIVIENEDLELENFSTIERLAALVERKLARRNRFT